MYESILSILNAFDKIPINMTPSRDLKAPPIPPANEVPPTTTAEAIYNAV